jgi:hypothetical protein
MAADIETLLGLGIEDASEADMTALAGQLRGQQQLGDFLSLSQIAPANRLGGALQKRASRAAKSGGTLRSALRREAESTRRYDESAEESARRYDQTFEADQQQRALTNARAAAAERRAQEQYDRSSNALRYFVGPGGRRIAGYRGEDDESGRPMFYDAANGAPLDLNGLREVTPGSEGRGTTYTSRAIKQIGANKNIPVRQNAEGQWVFLDSGEPVSPEGIAAREAGATGTLAEREQRKGQGKQRAKETEPALVGALADLGKLEGELRTADDALAKGAVTGPIAGRLPSFRTPSIKLDEVKDKIALVELGKYTFGSLSKSEADWLKGVSINERLPEDELRPQIQKRLDALQRMREAKTYELEQTRAGREVDPAVVDEILRRPGPDGQPFEFGDPKLGAGYTPDEAQVPPGLSPEAQRRWRLMTPEQQEAIRQRAGG